MKKIIIGIVIIAILVSGIVAGYILIQRQQEIRSQAAPATTLILSASPPAIDVGETTTVNVTIDTGVAPNQNEVASGEVHLEFDPNILSMDSFVAGPFMPAGASVQPASINNTAGTAQITFLNLDPGTPIAGSGVILVATFTSLAADPGSSVDVGIQSTITAIGEGGTNVLVGSTGTSVTVTETVETHLACVNEACVEVTGSGLDSCTVATQADDCAEDIVETHLICQNEACVEVTGAGIDECSVANQATTCAEDDNPPASPSPSPSASPAASPGTGGAGTGTGGTTNPSPTPAANLPESGVTGPTLMVAGFGMLFILLGLAALAL